MAFALTRQLSSISSPVARELKYYVYLYVNPLDGKVFYVGKGKNKRALAHLDADEMKAISKKFKEIREGGEKPQIEILAHGLKDPDDALKLEAAVIDIIGLKNLANVVRGHGAKAGRMPLQEVVSRYERRNADFGQDPVMLIRINKLYRYEMKDAELYDSTRSAWRVGPKRDLVKYALAVFEGVVKEVYEIKGPWLRAGSTFNTRRDTLGLSARDRRRRWEFVGRVAAADIHRRYVNRYVGHRFTRGAQNPISYVNDP
jgi:hypothetical protein